MTEELMLVDASSASPVRPRPVRPLLSGGGRPLNGRRSAYVGMSDFVHEDDLVAARSLLSVLRSR